MENNVSDTCGDHLGGANWITDASGLPVQTLNYLPYGEDWVERNFFSPGDTTRLGIYRFNGKEKDYESGFHYYGARYYWSELLTGWLSVDPMADKYPSISPYAYCAWNPVKLVDPDGRDTTVSINLDTKQIMLYYDSYERTGFYIEQVKDGISEILYSSNKPYDKYESDNIRAVITFENSDRAREIYNVMLEKKVMYEWNLVYYNDKSAALITSGLPDRVEMYEEDYKGKTVEKWRHYHPYSPDVMFWRPSEKDQILAEELNSCPAYLDFCGKSYNFAQIIKKYGIIKDGYTERYKEILEKQNPPIYPYCD